MSKMGFSLCLILGVIIGSCAYFLINYDLLEPGQTKVLLVDGVEITYVGRASKEGLRELSGAAIPDSAIESITSRGTLKAFKLKSSDIIQCKDAMHEGERLWSCTGLIRYIWGKDLLPGVPTPPVTCRVVERTAGQIPWIDRTREWRGETPLAPPPCSNQPH